MSPLLLLLVITGALLLPSRALPLSGRAPRRGHRVRGRRRPDSGAARRDGAELAELFAAGLESGLTPLAATSWCADGEVVPDAEQWWAARVPPVARALAVSSRLGSPAAAAVRSAAEAERARADVERELRSGLAGVRATAWLLTALPVGGVAAALAITGGNSVASPMTWAATGTGLVLTAAGWAWLRRLVSTARRRALR